MSFNFGSLLPSNDYIDQRKRASKLTKKWEQTGLLEGLKGTNVGNMAQLLENQAKQVLREANTTSTVAGSEEWAGIVLPLVRRTYGETINAKEFVSFQPMNLPNGLVFWLDFKYGSGQPGFNTNSGNNSQDDSLWGVSDPSRGTSATYGWATPTEGLYGAGRFGYSINDYSSSALAPASAASSTEFATGSVSAADYNYNSEFSQSLLVGGSSLIKVTISTASIANFDPVGVRAFTLSNSVGTVINEVFQEFTKYNKSAATVQFIVSGSGVTGSTRFLVNYHKQPTITTRGDFEVGKTQAGTGFDTPMDIPLINLEMRQESIVAKTRRIKTQWSDEFAEDLNAYHNIDTEAEITKMMADYMGKEIDLEILDMLISEATPSHVDYWSTRIGYEWNGSTFVPITQNLTAYVQSTWFQTIGTKLQKMSNRIMAATSQGEATFMVVSPMIATVLESIPGFAVDTDGTKNRFQAGIQKMGMMSNRWEVYKSPFMQGNVILMGRNGGTFLEQGAVYAPYIPFITTPTVYDPNNIQPRKAMHTRYAKRVLRSEFYGKIYVEGLNTI